VKLEHSIYEARLRAPLASAHGRTDVRRLVCVSVTGDDGLTGHGEAAPLESYDGVTVDDVVEALESWRGAIEAGEALPDGALPQAAAAVDLARWDLAGRRAGQPIWRLLGAPAAEPVEVNATIGGEEPATAAALARQARAAGFTCVKVKVGLEHDLERVRAVREASGPQMRIRIDANGAWTVPEAIAAIEALAPFALELCEEPVHGTRELAEVARAVPVPVAADETTSEPGLYARRACAAVCLKIAASGGIAGIIRDAERARKVGYEVYLASTLDGPLGIAAALHAAAAIGAERPCGLATLGRFVGPDPLPPAGGRMTPPSGPGLGLRQFS
jgi:L-alanine-DL-glutamate epimerase-like enolase superfamily enzyme